MVEFILLTQILLFLCDESSSNKFLAITKYEDYILSIVNLHFKQNNILFIHVTIICIITADFCCEGSEQESADSLTQIPISFSSSSFFPHRLLSH